MRSRSLVLIALGLAFALALPTSAQHLRIYYPDIEQGSSILVVSPTGRALLIDGGSGLRSTDDPIEDFINDLIDAGVVTSLDYTIASHYDEDHIGRLENVFQLVPLAPTAIAYDRGLFGGTPSTFAYSDYAFSAGMFNRTTIDPFTTLDLGGGVLVRCYVVNGDLPDGTSFDISASGQFENSTSVSVVVQYGDVDVWIGGDLTGNVNVGVSDVESQVAPFVGDVDVYTFNHHGSRTSSTAAFLSTLKAEVGINQNSANNNFGHPNTEVVSRFLATPDSHGAMPLFFQQNVGNPTDSRSDDALASGIADCDDITEPIGLPGTMLLISDGASYEIQGCGFGALTLAADTGPGSTGDFPPAILRVSRTPWVPLATEGTTVQANVDDVSAITVNLRYWLDGIEQAPIAMSAAGGTLYTATIPAQLDGTQVRYRVEATDAASQTELSFAQGYFSGVTPVATLRVNDSRGVLVPKHYAVRVEGNLTAEPGIFHPFVSQIYVQDTGGGVQVFDDEFLALARGDRVRFVGALEQFGGQIEINTAQEFGGYGATLVAPGSPPAAQVITVAQAGESFEGTLVRINGVTVTSGAIPQQGSGSLMVSDDGGATTLEIRIDGDTDIPGANTPTQSFDLIGVFSQFDSFAGFLSGYQLLPRERTDFLSEEVNHPAVLINEIHADPDSVAGDANGDGVVNTRHDEFVELVNTSLAAVDISGWTLTDLIQVRHTFPSGTVIPAREAAVVFSGGNPTGDFGNAAANGLVFTASTGRLALNNSSETLTLADNTGATVQVVTWGSQGSKNQSLTRDPDLTNAPLVLHTAATGSGGSRYSPGTSVSGQPFTVPAGAVILTEVVYDPSGADGGLEWVELYNTTSAPIDLSALSLGNGGSSYTSSLVQLNGTIAAGATFVVGGPTSSASNGNPTFDQLINFSPDFQNSGSTADGVALFNIQALQVTAATVPIDAVVYGGANTNGLIDETGAANAPEVGDAAGGSSIERVDLAGTWQIQPAPNPNLFTPGGPPPPPPAAGLLLSEVLYDVSGSDNGFEWVELYNPTAQAIDLASFSLGNGGSSYTSSKVQLSGSVPAGGTFVVGGPTSSTANGNPTFDLVINFSPDFQNSGSTADGVALFNVPASQITGSTVPIDAVVYGGNNTSGLIDETGTANAPEVGDAPAGSSIERTDLAGSWQIQPAPTPGSTGL